jgi:hypothetical protein
MANVSTRRSALDVNSTSNPVTLRVTANYDVQTSVPLEIGFAPDGHVDQISLVPALQNPFANYMLTRDHGMSIDAGFTYELDDLTQLSASFTDLGFIRWKNNLNTFSVNETIVYSQADINTFLNGPGQDDFASAMTSTLLNSVHASGAPTKYITALPFNLYGGIKRELSPTLKAGAMTWVEINSGHVRPSFTLSLNFTPFKAFAATVSYTLMNNKFNQIGGGLAFGQKGAQFFIVTDNIPVRYTKIYLPAGTPADQNAKTPVTIPYNARMLSLRFGMNLFFGCDKKSKSNDSGSRRHPKTKSRDECPAYW